MRCSDGISFEDVLRKFGISNKFINWMGCIRGPKFSVLVNGSLTEWFTSTKGFRQGDPLAPYLFIIVMEALIIRRVKDVAGAGMLKGIKLVLQGELPGMARPLMQ